MIMTKVKSRLYSQVINNVYQRQAEKKLQHKKKLTQRVDNKLKQYLSLILKYGLLKNGANI